MIYGISDKDGVLKLVPLFEDELPNKAIFYTNSGECHQKIKVGNESYFILLHPTIFSNSRESLDKLNY